MNKKILLLSQRPSDYVEIHRIARELNKYKFDLYILYIHDDYLNHISVLESLKELKKNGFISGYSFGDHCLKSRAFSHFIGNRARASKVEVRREFESKIVNFVWSFCRSIWYKIVICRVMLLKRFDLIFTLIKLSYRYRHTRLFLEDIIQKNKVDLIVMPEDVVGMVTPLLVKAGHKYGIPSVIIPYTIANQDEAFQSLKGNLSYSCKLKANYIVGLIFKKWCMTREGISLLRLPAAYVIMHELTRTSPPDPWLLHSGYADVICVESNRMYEYYIKSGLAKDKLLIVGAFYDDYLANVLTSKKLEKNKLISKLGLSNSKPILLIGGFPNQLVNCPKGVEFKKIEQVIEFIVNSLSGVLDKFTIIVRPHPNFSQLGELFQKYEGFIVSNLDTASLVAMADVYVAFASATIRWAISCAVPTINYDVFQYEYDDYKDVPGVINVRYKHEFRNAVSLITDSSAYSALRQDIDKEKNNWGQLDGRSGQRIVNLINELIEHKKFKRKEGLDYVNT